MVWSHSDHCYTHGQIMVMEDKISHKTLAQINLCPLCYLGNLQSGVQVVRKTALNYSERESFQADLWSYSTRYGVGKEMYASGYSHLLDTSQPFMALLHIICKGCLLQLTDVLFNCMGLTNLAGQWTMEG